MKKCQACAKPAVFHITEIEDGDPREVHFCEEHFHQYMQAGGPAGGGTGDLPADQALKAIGEVEDDPAVRRGGGKTCPHCGITFKEFRERGRFGCPNDYDVFREQLLPLIENIHDHAEHAGKRPTESAGTRERLSQLIRLRKSLGEAVEQEDYEAAARLRDEIGALTGGAEATP